MTAAEVDGAEVTAAEVDGAEVTAAEVDGAEVTAVEVDGSVGRETELAELRRQAGRLVTELVGPLRRIHLRRGDTVLEVEWQATAAPPDPAGAPGSVPVGIPGQVADGTAGSGSAGTAGPVLADSAARIVPPRDGGGDGRRIVAAPMVGTYYRAAEPGGAPFVEVGDKVEPGQVVCVVEAMKLMNEVVADQVGRVVEVLVRDGEPVEFGQPLIALLPA